MSGTLPQTEMHALPPDYQKFDEFHVKACFPYSVERANGEKWFVGAVGQLFYKGAAVADVKYESVKDAINHALPSSIVADEVVVLTRDEFKNGVWVIKADVSFCLDDETVFELEFDRTSDAVTSRHVEYKESVNGLMRARDRCDQEGCDHKATVKLWMNSRRCDSCAQETNHAGRIWYRQFCEMHSDRGTLDVEDCNENYVRVPL